MSTKNYGPLTSYLDPDGRSWETTVFQAGKPVLSQELNLQEDLATDTRRLTRLRACPSGWLANDFLNSSDPSSGIFLSSVSPNFIGVPPLLARVNDWNIPVNNTEFNGANVLDLGANPVGVGARRQDLVILEVWRRLIPPSPSTVGKSPAGRIWRDGNVKVAAADDLALNYADDILDPMVAAETTKRVQIQYRLRVIQGIDLYAYPYGIDDPLLFANSVPTAAALPDGVVTAFNYGNQSANVDSGLWRAGDGNPANALNTVDGYMYALPLMGVVRRNTSAFDRNTNHNGGVAFGGPSDRPDGLFYDVIDIRDIIDLRMGISPSGWNFTEVLTKNFNLLLDNETRTEIGSTFPVGGGVDGHTTLVADEIGVLPGVMGISGDTPGANFIGQFDAVRRRFSDRAQTETIVLNYTPANQSIPGAVWVATRTITVSPTALPVYQEAGAFNWASRAPAEVSFTNVDISYFWGTTLASEAAFSSITGLGGCPQGPLTVTLGAIPAGVTNEPLIIRVTVVYPSGWGLTRTPTDVFVNSLYYNNPLQLPAAAPVLYNATDGFAIDPPHREVTLTYQTVDQTYTTAPISTTQVFSPDRIQSLSVAVTVNGPPYAGTVTPDESGYYLNFSAGPALAPTDVVVFTFKALRPFPENDEQVTVYYEARQPQTTRDALLGGTTLLALPRHIPEALHTITVGSGSEDEAYPFPFQYVQAGGVYPTSGGTFNGDHELDGRALITVANFNASTGLLKLPTLVPYVPAPDQAKFDRTPGDVDAEGRTYYPESSFGVYAANAFAQELSNPNRHKVLLPVLAELVTDTPWGFAGQLFMVVLSRWALFDKDNSVDFNSDLTQNTTTASVYRIKGNLLNRRSQ
jgi:hypothetical protein